MNKSHHRSTFLRFTNFIKTRAIFLLLLPIFFVLHGFIANYGAVNSIDAFLLTIFYIVIAFAIAGISWLFYRDVYKASLLAFAVMAYHFFFGVIQDVLTDISPHSVFSQFRFILPVSLLFFLGMVIWLKKRKKTLFSITSYLNILLLLLIVMDAGILIFKTIPADKNQADKFSKATFTACDTCKKPDVYFILLDQYAGKIALKEVFNFDNAPFETELSRRGFHIAQKSTSNYNLTPFSMASTLNMDYLGPEMNVINHLNVTYSYRVIRNSRTINYFKAEGYEFYNLSLFDFPGQPAHKYTAFLPYGTELITAQTFISRIKKAIRTDIISGKIRLKSIREKLLYEHLHFNDNMFELTKDVAAKRVPEPKFVYTHFILPHWPYYYDSKGRPVPVEKLQGGVKKTNATDYIEYLQYANGRVLQLVDHIFSVSPAPPVIILLSDHGFRDPERKANRKYDFCNLDAIYLPDKNYGQFSDDLSNVNFFRTFFNSCFNQHFPLLKDSTINLWE